MKKALKVTGIVILSLIIVLLGVVSFGLGGIIKKAVVTMGPEALGAPVELEAVRVFPLRGLVQIKGLMIGNPEGFHTDSAIQLAEFKVKIKLGSLMTDKIIISELLIDTPEITYERSLKSSNVARLQENVEAFIGPQAEPTEEEPAVEEVADAKPAKKVQIDKLIVRNGAVKLSFTALRGKQMTLPLPGIEKEGIGAEGDGATFADAAKEVWSSIMDGVKGVASGAGDAFKGVGGAVGDGAGAVKDGATSLIKGVGGIFKKDD